MMMLATRSTAALLATASTLAAAEPRGSFDDVARLLAGLPPAADPEALALAAEPSWQRHAEALDKAWCTLETERLGKVRKWAQAELPASTSPATLFYMFSGPDFLYANAIFPRARTYVLCGIEPVGRVPTDLRRQTLGHDLAMLRTALDPVLSFSFFITNKMKTDLQHHRLAGTLPVLAIFLARAGMTISAVEFVGLDAAGTLHEVAAPVREGVITAPGVRFQFRGPGDPEDRTLFYFSTDISDSGLKGSGFLDFCRPLAPGNSLVKSASYLMHKSYFSNIRAFLLEHSETLVQDDSGIPCVFLLDGRWQLRLFGAYPGPIALFKEHHQPRLAALYREARPTPLDFGIGYRHRKGESTWIVATKRPEPPVAEDPPPRAIPVEEPKPPSPNPAGPAAAG
jgi:hypothetical protein